jgi:hypothetical protein
MTLQIEIEHYLFVVSINVAYQLGVREVSVSGSVTCPDLICREVQHGKLVTTDLDIPTIMYGL